MFVCPSFMTSTKSDSNHYNNNLRLVYGLRNIGKLYGAAETLRLVMKLLQPPSTFYEYYQVIMKTIEKESMKS